MGGFQICSETPEASLSQLLLNFAHERMQRSFFISQGLETARHSSASSWLYSSSSSVLAPSPLQAPLSSPISLSPSPSFRCSQQVCVCLGDSAHASLVPILERHCVVMGDDAREDEGTARSFNRSCEELLSQQTGDVFRIAGLFNVCVDTSHMELFT